MLSYIKTITLSILPIIFVFLFVKFGYINPSGLVIEDNIDLFKNKLLVFTFNEILIILSIVIILSVLRYLLELFNLKNFLKNTITSILFTIGLIIGTILNINSTFTTFSQGKLLTKNKIIKNFSITADKFNINSYIANVSIFNVKEKINNLAGFNISGKYMRINNIDNGYNIFIKNFKLNNKVAFNSRIGKINFVNKITLNAKNVKFEIPENNIDANLLSMLYIYTKYIPLNFKGNGELLYNRKFNKYLVRNFNLNNKFISIKNANILIINKSKILLLKGTYVIHISNKNINELYNLYKTFYKNFKEKVNINVLKLNVKKMLSYEDFINFLYTYLKELNNKNNININLEGIENNFDLLLNGKNIKFDINININN